MMGHILGHKWTHRSIFQILIQDINQTSLNIFFKKCENIMSLNFTLKGVS